MDLNRIKEAAQGYEKDMTAFLRAIVKNPGESCDERAHIETIAAEMRKLDFDDVVIDPQGNVIGYMGTGDRIIAFDAHIDTVGIGNIDNWTFDPYEGYETETEIGGRGVSDQCGGIVSAVYGAKIMKEQDLIPEGCKIMVVGTVQEEDCDGLCWQYIINEDKVRPEFVVSTEPTDGGIYRGQRGRMEIRIDVKGVSCHGSAPERGDNAIYKMADILQDIRALNENDAEDGTEIRELIHQFDGSGIIQGIHNTDKSITSFARACFSYALDTKQDLWFATKDTISKKYDHNFKDIFADVYEKEYKEKFEVAGLEYFYTLIDDAVARVMKTKGGFIWACKNYDGDVMSDMVSSACGSLAMMTSVLVSPDGVYEYEAAHGTVQRHYYKHLKGEETSTNSVATIFAWTGALRKRGELDEIPELMTFADKLEKATLQTIESGKMTKDLALITELEDVTVLNSEQFIQEIRATMEALD